MNELSIEFQEFKYKGNDDKQHSCIQAEFLIDTKSLAKIFGFDNDRPWFGNTVFEESESESESESIKSREIKSLLGESEPKSQFEDGRQVLYRCHCGCDYCGIVSCKVERSGEFIIWRDVRFQHDVNEFDKVIFTEVVFEYESYSNCIQYASNT